MKYNRTYNFSAGPAMMPEPVLEEIRDEMITTAAPYNVSKNYSIGKTGTAGRGLPALRITRRPFVTSIVYKPPKLRYNKTNKNFDESRSYHAHQSDRTLLQ